jgi:hypothetical protein
LPGRLHFARKHMPEQGVPLPGVHWRSFPKTDIIPELLGQT